MENEQKYSVFKGFSKPFSDLMDHFGTFLKISSVFALLLTLVSFLFGQSFVCMLLSLKERVYCSNNILLYVIYVFCKLFVVAVFLRIWYDVVYLQKNFSRQYFKENPKRFLRFFGVFIGFILLNLLPALSLYLLFVRVPNPVWQVEMIYFTIVSIGFLVPFICIRFYTNLAEYIEDKPYRNFKEIYEKTRGKLSKIFFSFIVVLAFSLFVFLVVNNNLRIHVFEPLWLYNIFAEYLFEWIALLVMAVLLNFIRVQKESFE